MQPALVYSKIKCIYYLYEHCIEATTKVSHKSSSKCNYRLILLFARTQYVASVLLPQYGDGGGGGGGDGGDGVDDVGRVVMVLE